MRFPFFGRGSLYSQGVSNVSMVDSRMGPLRFAFRRNATLRLKPACRLQGMEITRRNGCLGRPGRHHRYGCPRLSSRSSIKRRSEEHTSELQSHSDLVCRLLLEKKKKNINKTE